MNNKKTNKTLADYQIVSIILPAAIIIIWQLLGNFNRINTAIMPTPTGVIRSLMKLINRGTLVSSIIVSFKRVLSGYLLGASLGVLLGVLTGVFPLIDRILSLLISVLRPIPIIAWFPILIMWCGIGELSKIIVIAIGTLWPVLIAVYDGIKEVDEKYIEVARIMMKPKSIILIKVIIPAASGAIFSGLRVGIGTAWSSVISAELIAASSGLGYLISYSREMSLPGNVLVGVFTIGLVGWLINALLGYVEKTLVPWNKN